jgi:hypothetical protein
MLSSQVNTATSGLPAAHAAIVAEQTTRAGADTGIAATVTTLSAQVNNGITGLPAAHAAIVTEGITRANADTANASAASTVQARLDTGDYAAVKTQSSASVTRLGAIEAKHAIKVDANGHVAGIELISDGSVSSIVLLSDKLLWVMPDGTGAPRQILVAGNVNGVATVGLDANLIIDGSIAARNLAADSVTTAALVAGAVTAAEINVGSLAAVSAILGAVHAGSIDIDATGFVKSGQSAYDTGTGFWLGMSGGVPKISIGSTTKGILWDGAALIVRGNIIATGNINDGAVTNRYDASSTTDIDIATDSTVWTDIISGPLTSTGKPIDVSFNVDLALQVATGQQSVKLRILRGATAIYDPGTFLSVNGGLSTFWTRKITDLSAAGAYTFKVQAQRSPSGQGVKTTEQSVSLIEFKK